MSKQPPRLARKIDLHSLTARDKEILEYFAEGRNAHWIAERLLIAEKTIRWHTERIRQKFCVNSTWAAYVEAVREGQIACPCKVTTCLLSDSTTSIT